MKMTTPLLAALFFITLSFAHAEKDFDINNDLFFAQVKAPATKIHQQQLNEDGQLTIETTVFYNDVGFATKGLTQIDNTTITLDYEAYQDHQRIITLSSTHVTNTLKTVWSSPYSSSASDGDMFSEYTFNEEGDITHQKNSFENEPKLTEITHFYYFNDENEAKLQSTDLLNKLKAGERLTMITDIERDRYGSWLKRRELTSDGILTTYIRTIKYSD